MERALRDMEELGRHGKDAAVSRARHPPASALDPSERRQTGGSSGRWQPLGDSWVVGELGDQDGWEWGAGERPGCVSQLAPCMLTVFTHPARLRE